MKHLFLASFSLALCSFAATADARCRQMGVAPELISPDRALAADGALVVRLVPIPGRPGRPTTNTFPAMTLTSGTERIPLRLEALTASLARYVPTRVPSAGRWRVDALERDVMFGTGRAPALAAPRVASVRSESSSRGRRGSQYTFTAALATAAPTHALAVYAKHADGSFGDARGVGGRSALTVFDWRTRCRLWPDGMTQPPTSGTVRLRFVGEDGQLSPASAPIRIP